VSKRHGPAFVALVDDAKTRIAEVDVDRVRARLAAGEAFFLVDVREESEFARDRIAGARHLGKGILERDVEAAIPDRDADVVLYCGGGYRSALAADNLQKMGYRRVVSLAGGIRAWREAGHPLEEGAPGAA